MKQFQCSVCGYIYTGDALPADFVCPLCGAPASAFVEIGTPAAPAKPKTKTTAPIAARPKVKAPKAGGTKAAKKPVSARAKTTSPKLSAGELTTIFSNLAKGCEKQHLLDEMAAFQELSDYFAAQVLTLKSKKLADLIPLLGRDLSESYPSAKTIATATPDRGALRALVWSEKATTMAKALVERYEEVGDEMLADTKIHVCDACGFIFIGDSPPDACPVCRVPQFKFIEIGKG